MSVKWYSCWFRFDHNGGWWSTSNVTVVLGGQWGDEGKGKLVDLLARKADYICRCQVFSNLVLFLNCVAYKLSFFKTIITMYVCCS